MDVLRCNNYNNGTQRIPPEQIPKISLNGEGDAIPGVVFFGSESDGFATGTEGFVNYREDQFGGVLRIGWNNPFAGSNGFGVSVPDGYTYTHGDISGNNANVTIIREQREKVRSGFSCQLHLYILNKTWFFSCDRILKQAIYVPGFSTSQNRVAPLSLSVERNFQN